MSNRDRILPTVNVISCFLSRFLDSLAPPPSERLWSGREPSVPGGGTFLIRCKHSFIGQEGSSSHSSSIISHKARLWEESDDFRTTKRRKREKKGEEGKMTVLKGVASSNRFVAVRLFFIFLEGAAGGAVF